MRKIGSYVISIIMMMVMSVLCLLVVSTLVYLLKWQADKAMAGIIVTYILAGFTGGFCFKRLEKIQYGYERKIGIVQKAVEAFLLSCIFMLILFVLSIFVLQNPFEISGRFFMIWGLFVSSTFLGRIL